TGLPTLFLAVGVAAWQGKLVPWLIWLTEILRQPAVVRDVLPHAICLDAKGRVYVGDRENNRIQVFDPDGKFLTQWKEGGSPFGLFLTSEGRLFVADGRADWEMVLDLQGNAIARSGEEGTRPGRVRTPHAGRLA